MAGLLASDRARQLFGLILHGYWSWCNGPWRNTVVACVEQGFKRNPRKNDAVRVMPGILQADFQFHETLATIDDVQEEKCAAGRPRF